MTNTIEALDQFTQAIGPMLPPASPLGPGLRGEPSPAHAQASPEPAPPRSGGAALTGPASHAAAPDLDPLSALPAAARSSHGLGAAVPGSPLPFTHSLTVGTLRGAHPADNPPDPLPAEVTAAGATKSQPAARGTEGITRKGPRGDWPRRIKLTVLALTIGFGLTRAVRATERVGGSYWRQQVGKSLASRQHGDPAPFVLRALPFLSSAARGSHS